jgi:hypothetical protein
MILYEFILLYKRPITKLESDRCGIPSSPPCSEFPHPTRFCLDLPVKSLIPCSLESSTMSFVPFNNDSDSSSHDVIRPAPPLVSRHLEVDYEALTLQDVSFPESNDFLDVAGFPTDLFPIFPPQASPTGPQHVPRSQVIGDPQRRSRSPRGPQQPGSSRSFSEPFIYPPAIPQSPFDGTYSLSGEAHPSAWPGPGSTIYGGGGGGYEQAAPAVAVPSISGTVPITMMAPAAAPFSSLSMHHVTVPTSGSPAGAHMPVVRPWTAAPTGACQCPRAAVPPPPPPIPTTPFCRCRLRAHPLVRVDDMIEWVRPDLMRMSVWFNWSLNADAEAHESWERRRG